MRKPAKPIPHEVTLYAFTQDPRDGALCLCDVIDTSRKFAPWWMRRWYRDADVTHISAVKAGYSPHDTKPRKYVK